MTETLTTTPRFALVSPDQPADELELELLERWRQERLFERTVDVADGAPSFVFYEGPPTANGRPGIHHVFARAIKDLFCRHRAMKGFRVERKAGWDTHGLPVEIEVEKRLGISGKQDIEKLGVAEFNRLCRESVFTYRADWERLSERIGYSFEDVPLLRRAMAHRSWCAEVTGGPAFWQTSEIEDAPALLEATLAALDETVLA